MQQQPRITRAMMERIGTQEDATAGARNLLRCLLNDGATIEECHLTVDEAALFRHAATRNVIVPRRDKVLTFWQRWQRMRDQRRDPGSTIEDYLDAAIDIWGSWAMLIWYYAITALARPARALLDRADFLAKRLNERLPSALPLE